MNSSLNTLLAMHNLTLISLDNNKIKFKCSEGHLVTCSQAFLSRTHYKCPKCAHDDKSNDFVLTRSRNRKTKSNIKKLINRHFFSFNDTDKHGVYCIINNTLKIVYVGETLKSFRERWLSHILRSLKGKFISKSPDKYKELIFHKDTKFIILYKDTLSREENLAKEKFFINLYKRYTNYTVLGGAWKDKFNKNKE